MFRTASASHTGHGTDSRRKNPRLTNGLGRPGSDHRMTWCSRTTSPDQGATHVCGTLMRSSSILRRPLYVIEHENGYRDFLRLQLEPELLPQRFLERESGLIRRRLPGLCLSISHRRPFQVEIELAAETGAIHQRPARRGPRTQSVRNEIDGDVPPTEVEASGHTRWHLQESATKQRESGIFADPTRRSVQRAG